MTKDRVSALCRQLDEQVEAFRQRPLEGAYPYLWLDAKQLKVRDQGHVRSKALVVAYAVHETGRREVLGIDLGEVESEAFWLEFLRSLRRRGLGGVRLAVSDDHEGLKAAIARLLACPWQRCTVHFVRSMHQHCRPAQRSLVSAALRKVFNAADREQARERVFELLARLAPVVPKVCALLDSLLKRWLLAPRRRPPPAPGRLPGGVQLPLQPSQLEPPRSPLLPLARAGRSTRTRPHRQDHSGRS